jgi:hypothetical protein
MDSNLVEECILLKYLFLIRNLPKGIFKSINVNKCTRSGCTFTFWVADWFALLNNKMGGDLKKIRIVGEYMIEVEIYRLIKGMESLRYGYGKG